MFILALLVLATLAACAQRTERVVSADSNEQASGQETTSTERPNVVMIISDDQAWDDFSFLGHPVIETPHVDRLARESATFVNGYVPSSLCRPSLATIVTGQYPHQHGITGNDPPEGTDRQRMLRFIAHAESLPRVLRELGYASMQTGKWWEGHYGTGGFTHGMTINNEEQGRHGDQGLQIGRQTMQPIYDFVEAHRETPFFLWYAPFLPHTPHNPPERLLEKYREEGRPESLAKYYAMVEWFDETVGQLLGYLDEQGLRENTIVLFVVDNGWIQNVGWEREDYPEEMPFAPRSKRSPYERGVRTPIMVRWAGHVEAGRRKELASTVDFFPTVLDAVGAQQPQDLPGRSLLKLAEGTAAAEGTDAAAREAVYGEIFTHDVVNLSRPTAGLKYRWVRRGEWKLIEPYDAGPAADEKARLYNIAEDPGEERNRIGEHPEIVEELRERLDDWWQPRHGFTGGHGYGSDYDWNHLPPER